MSCGVIAMLLQEDLQGQLASQVVVAALEHGTHAAAGDLAEDLVAARRVGDLGGGGLDQRALVPRISVAKQDAGDRAERVGERLEDAAGSRGGPESRGQAAVERVDGGVGSVGHGRLLGSAAGRDP